MENLEIHENLDAQPELLQALLETPRRCMLLSPKLTLQQRRGIAREHYVVTVQHEEEPHHAIICGFYRHSHNKEVEVQQRETWEELADDAADASPIWEELLESPHCLLLNPKLTAAQLEHQSDIFYVVPIEHKGEKRHAALCGYFEERGRIWQSCPTGVMRADGIQTHGEGLSLSLREGAAFFYRSAGFVFISRLRET